MGGAATARPDVLAATHAALAAVYSLASFDDAVAFADQFDDLGYVTVSTDDLEHLHQTIARLTRERDEWEANEQEQWRRAERYRVSVEDA